MTGITHKQFAWAWGASAALIFEPYIGLSGCAAMLIGAHAGSTAPDYLEMGIIKHRTLTHLPWLWILMYSISVLVVGKLGLGVVVVSLVTGYCLGALSHLFGDWGTPMGIPLITTERRYSLNMWRTGKISEKIPVLLAWGLAALLGVFRFSFTNDEWQLFFSKSEAFFVNAYSWLGESIRGPLF